MRAHTDEEYTIDKNGIPHNGKGEPIIFIQTPIEVKTGYGFMVHYPYRNRYYKYPVINGIKGKVTRVSFFDFMNVLKGESK